MVFNIFKKVVLWGVLLTLLFFALLESRSENWPGLPAEQIIITKAIGDQSNRTIPYFRNIWRNGDTMVVKLNSDTHQSSQMLRGIILFKTKAVVEALFSEISDINTVTIHWYYPMEVVGGRLRDQPIVKVTFSRKDLKSGWSNTPIGNLPSLADSYWEHQALSQN